MPVEVVTTVPGRVNQRYRLPQQFAPGFVYVSGDDELNAFVEAVKWTEQHPL